MTDEELKKKQEEYRNCEWWIFTFGVGQEHGGRYVKIHGTFEEARQKMFDEFGTKWCWQYSENEWKEFEEKAKNGTLGWTMETLLKVIE